MTEILVAIDEGEHRHVALEFAAADAVASGRDLRIVHVVHPLNRVVPRQPQGSERRPPEPDPEASTAHRLLDEAADVVRSRYGDSPAVRTEILEGMPLPVILEAAGESAKVYLQRRHLSPLDNVLNGPVVAGVAARSPVPVVVVPEAFSGWDLPGRRRVTVAVKRTGHQEELLEEGFRTASRMQAGLKILRVVEPHRLHGVMHGVSLPGRHHPEHAAPHVETLTTAELRLLEYLAAWRGRFPEVPTRAQVLRQRAVIALLEATADSDVLLISRPPTRLPANALGTLSRALIREAVCPVAIVPVHPHVPSHVRSTPYTGADARGPIY